MPKKMLVIEPESHMRRLEVINLRRAGYEVEELQDYREGYAKAKEWQPDVIVMELVFPGNRDGGYDLHKQLREDPDTVNIGTVIYTDRSEDQDVFRGWAEGVDCYLTKPFNPMELLTFVKRLVDCPPDR